MKKVQTSVEIHLFFGFFALFCYSVIYLLSSWYKQQRPNYLGSSASLFFSLRTGWLLSQLVHVEGQLRLQVVSLVLVDYIHFG